MRDKEEKETHANFNTWHKKPPLKSPSPFEKQMSTIYTHEIFKKFQVEVLGASACFCLNEGDNGMKKTFKVQDFEKNVNFIVTWNVNHKQATYMCRKFESYGFLCRHVICVLQSLGIFYVPPDYILQRWTKNAKAFDSIKINSSGVQSKKQRFDELIHQATKLSEEASSSNETYIIAYRVLNEALEKCVTMNHSLKKFELYEACDVEEEDMDSNKLHDTSLHDPQISSTKGAPKRIKSGIEKSRKKKPNDKSRKEYTSSKDQSIDDFHNTQVYSQAGHSNIVNLLIDNHHDVEQDLQYTVEKSPVVDIDSSNRNPDSGILWNNNSASTKQEKVGSLTFNVIDASSSPSSAGSGGELLSTQAVKFAADAGASPVKNSARKPASRAKVPFEKGYSQVDWLKLTRAHPDLAGLKGQSNRRLITMSEVKQNQTEGAMWTVFKGRVYNISPYMKFHPGGVDMLMKGVGKDCTALFNKYHAWVNAEVLLEKCLVGTLDESSRSRQ
ncbi:hypothetical protein Dsin_010954 [Dipteronia sinensis]|uniref:Cytochrome b5 heme-binding domain-containing protein n=1 Tax=Dipteronia sinensis TaxID=43782 RepID=A0AAE0EDC4_9ROSI|nr:hypothetical protein Dsin_010954 [Dipteronia sinensis]